MVGNLLQQFSDRQREVEGGYLEGQGLQEQYTHFDKLVKGLKEKVEKLKEIPDADKRAEYVKKVDQAYADLKAAKPAPKPTEKETEDVKAKKAAEAKAKQDEKEAQEAKEEAEAREADEQAKADLATAAAAKAAQDVKDAEAKKAASTKKEKQG